MTSRRVLKARRAYTEEVLAAALSETKPGPDVFTVWSCKIGEVHDSLLPPGADLPMRQAVEQAYYKITGQQADFTFSGWGAELTPEEREVWELDKRGVRVISKGPNDATPEEIAGGSRP